MENPENHNTSNILIALTVAVFVILGGMVWADYRDKQKEKELDQILLNRAKAYQNEDTVVVADTIVKEESTQSSPQEIKGSHYTSNNNSSDSYDDEDEEETRKHPGTPPDDGMFGFDYYDDEDDAYEMDRNQSDAYPDDW